MKTIVVTLNGYIGSTCVVKVVLGRFFSGNEAHHFFETMEASDTESTERLKKNLDAFFRMKLMYMLKKEDQIL